MGEQHAAQSGGEALFSALGAWLPTVRKMVTGGHATGVGVGGPFREWKLKTSHKCLITLSR